MILKSGDPGTHDIEIFDSITGEKLNFITSIDTESGEAWGYPVGPDGRLTMEHEGGRLVTVRLPNPVVWAPKLKKAPGIPP